jgi:hypothetical protein
MRSTLRRWDDRNEVAARIILSDPGRYAGLPVAWADRWVAREQSAVTPTSRKTIPKLKEREVRDETGNAPGAVAR